MNAHGLSSRLPRATIVSLVFLIGGCAGQPAASSPTASPVPSPAAVEIDLDEIVIPPASPPAGMTLSDSGGDQTTLPQLPLFPETAAALAAAPGFVDGRWSRFAGSADDFEASKNFLMTWVALYATSMDAARVFGILRRELTAEDRYGWAGVDAALGDEGVCGEGENPQLGGLREMICIWRSATLVMVVGGGSENDEPIEMVAEDMQARAASATD